MISKKKKQATRMKREDIFKSVLTVIATISWTWVVVIQKSLDFILEYKPGIVGRITWICIYSMILYFFLESGDLL